jgi:hypothetical protein
MAATSRAHFWDRCGAFFSCSRAHCSGVGTSVSWVRFAVRVAGGRGVRRGGRASAGFRRGRGLRGGRVLVWLTSLLAALSRGVVVRVCVRPRPCPRRGCGPTRAGAREAVDAPTVTGGHHLGCGGSAGGEGVGCRVAVVVGHRRVRRA